MVMNTAVRDGLLLRNPCQLQGAGVVKSKERPIASPVQVVALVEAITPRYCCAPGAVWAQTGATLPDLMKRLGHSTMAAARRYLHAVDGRDREIAKALSELAAHGDAARLPNRLGPGG
jgi:hypothetical protein